MALTLYAVLPVLRNAIAGLAGVDPAVIEAADAVGMTPAQRLVQVEAPLAAPVVMAGIRTAAVWTIGAATLSTSVGQTSLAITSFQGCRPRTGSSCCSAAWSPRSSRSPLINCWV